MTSRVLFVCLGNICRSPMAEGMFRDMAQRSSAPVEIDSAGTGDWHVGSPPDPRAQAAMKKARIDISDLRARQFVAEDFSRFDLIIAMDAANLQNIEKLRPAGALAPTRLMLDYIKGGEGRDLPDPYYGGDDGFELTVKLVRQSCAGLLKILAPVSHL